jgi:hypothetical protein
MRLRWYLKDPAAAHALRRANMIPAWLVRLTLPKQECVQVHLKMP